MQCTKNTLSGGCLVGRGVGGHVTLVFTLRRPAKALAPLVRGKPLQRPQNASEHNELKRNILQ